MPLCSYFPRCRKSYDGDGDGGSGGGGDDIVVLSGRGERFQRNISTQAQEWGQTGGKMLREINTIAGAAV